MSLFTRFFCCLLLFSTVIFSRTIYADDTLNIPILCYHNFNPTVPGSMNLTPAKFETQLKWILDNGYTVIPLKEAVDYLQGKRASLPAKSVVITADDGWQSVYTYMYPIIKKYHVPVTLFIYPQTISEGKHAMTWQELKELQQTGLFDLQGHTEWHPNFKQERKKMSPANYEKFVTMQLAHSKTVLEDKLGTKITLLAWPFGIYDKYLEQQAAKAGYTMAFSIDARPANKNYRPMAQPRFMIIDALSMKTFAGIINGAKTKSPIVNEKASQN
ncbi:MAG: polysaccharide deacetylase family protein [Gammaproteobacteria bacterium]|nr:polysaccharide deacetylase family protein [Gammaproteobacteria bacterium]